MTKMKKRALRRSETYRLDFRVDFHNEEEEMGGPVQVYIHLRGDCCRPALARTKKLSDSPA